MTETKKVVEKWSKKALFGKFRQNRLFEKRFLGHFFDVFSIRVFLGSSAFQKISTFSDIRRFSEKMIEKQKLKTFKNRKFVDFWHASSKIYPMSKNVTFFRPFSAFFRLFRPFWTPRRAFSGPFPVPGPPFQTPFSASDPSEHLGHLRPIFAVGTPRETFTTHGPNGDRGSVGVRRI